MNQSEFRAITSNLLKARETSRVQGALSFGFVSHCFSKLAREFLSQSLNVAIAIASFPLAVI